MVSKNVFTRICALLLVKVGVKQTYLIEIYNWLRRRYPDNLRHPYDLQHGVSTSGSLPNYLLQSGQAAEQHTTGFSSMQPSIIRWALNRIPRHETLTFIDFGCGKGRALLVASEYPLAAIEGIELAHELYHVAKSNAAIFARSHPERTPINVMLGDATEHTLPASDLLVYMFNPFAEAFVVKLLERIEQSLVSERTVYLIYVNPIHKDTIDCSASFSCLYDEVVPVEATEASFASDPSYRVAIWRNAPLAGN